MAITVEFAPDYKFDCELSDREKELVDYVKKANAAGKTTFSNDELSEADAKVFGGLMRRNAQAFSDKSKESLKQFMQDYAAAKSGMMQDYNSFRQQLGVLSKGGPRGMNDVSNFISGGGTAIEVEPAHETGAGFKTAPRLVEGTDVSYYVDKDNKMQIDAGDSRTLAQAEGVVHKDLETRQNSGEQLDSAEVQFMESYQAKVNQVAQNRTMGIQK